MPILDLAVVGGGIIGLATARELLIRFPQLRLAVLEKEPELALHQSGRNSGVIHSGIYYRPDSVKAKTCVTGGKLMIEFCKEHGIANEICGKVVIATKESEVSVLEHLYAQGKANGVEGLALIGRGRLREIEPHSEGVKALHVPGAGIADFPAVAQAMAKEIKRKGGDIRTSTRTVRLSRRDNAWVLETNAGEILSRFLVTCGGLYADRLAKMAGSPNDIAIVPFRGEYYELMPERRFLVRGMIYPVPKAGIPFLGVHFTRTLSGGIEIGPNAVLAMKREGYGRGDINLRDLFEMLKFQGFWKMAQKRWLVGMIEFHRAFSRQTLVRELRRLVPEVKSEDLRPGKRGVRAQAVDLNGMLVDDFNIVQDEHAIHVRNVPSPAATASMAIARRIAGMAKSAFSGIGSRQPTQ